METLEEKSKFYIGARITQSELSLLEELERKMEIKKSDIIREALVLLAEEYYAEDLSLVEYINRIRAMRKRDMMDEIAKDIHDGINRVSRVEGYILADLWRMFELGILEPEDVDEMNILLDKNIESAEKYERSAWVVKKLKKLKERNELLKKLVATGDKKKIRQVLKKRDWKLLDEFKEKSD